MKNVAFLLVLVALNFHTAFAQNIDYSKFSGEKINVNAVVNIPECYFKIYFDSLDRAYSVYKSVDSLQNSTPEELLTSLFSAQNRTWIIQFYRGIEPNISENDMNRRSTSDSTNYFQLVHKLTFNHNGTQTSILKYVEYINREKAGTYSCQMQNISGKWFFVKNSDILKIEEVIKSIKTDYFGVFVSGTKTDNNEIDDFVKSTREQIPVLNITKLGNELKNFKVKKPSLYNIICDN